jgi:tellurite resistance protein
VGRDLNYDQTVLMLGVLAASADGQLAPAERQVIAQRLAPHLGRLGQDGQAKTLRLLDDLLETVGMERTLLTLRSHLQFPQDRADAVKLAVSVAFADGHISPREAEHVAWLADLLGLDEAQLRQALGR